MQSKQQASGGRAAGHRAPRALGCCLLTPMLTALCLFIAYKIDNTEPQITLPGHPMPQDNARDYFRRAHAVAKLMKHLSPYDMSGPPAQSYTLANFQGCAVDAEPALKIMREGLKHPYMNSAARSAKTVFPELAEFRDLARVNAGAADYYAVTGSPGRAMQMRLDGLEMGVMIPRGGVLISRLVGIACEAIAESRTEPLIPTLSSTELASAAARLDQISAKRVPYAETILEEGYAQTAYILESLKDPKTKANPYKAALDMLGGGFEDGSETWRERMSIRMAAIKFTMQSKSSMLRENSEWNSAMAREARGTFLGPSKIPVPNNVLADLIGGVTDHTRQMMASRDAAIALLRVEVALFRYQKANGKFPANLSGLTPNYLSTVPVDPCGGKPLHYALQDGGASFKLYSVGPDLNDDGGVPAKNINAPQGDIVAGALYNKMPILYLGPSKTQ